MTRDPMDRIAELCVRHHLGQYDGTSIAARLDALFSVPLDNLAETEAALRLACDYLRIDGSQLHAMNAQADQLAKHHRGRADRATKHAEVTK